LYIEQITTISFIIKHIILEINSDNFNIDVTKIANYI